LRNDKPEWKPWRDLCATINARTMPSYLFDKQYGEAPRGPNGRKLCKWCGTEVPKGRRTICSAECQFEINIRISPNMAAHYVYKRDKGVCARCGIDTDAVASEIVKMAKGDRKARYGETTAYRLFLRENNLHRHLWEAHHKHSIAEGGSLCGLDGYETLCVWCHARETKSLRARLKMAEDQQPQQIQQLSLI
jgi:5-methylcytosine-specific restriction protein A